VAGDGEFLHAGKIAVRSMNVGFNVGPAVDFLAADFRPGVGVPRWIVKPGKKRGVPPAEPGHGHLLADHVVRIAWRERIGLIIRPAIGLVQRPVVAERTDHRADVVAF